MMFSFFIVQETSFPYDNKCFTRMHILFYKNKKYPSAQVFRKYTCTNGYFIKIIWLQ